ncbi:TolC family protein, partial [bacterium]|nr:TolC family protein [bacterium]
MRKVFFVMLILLHFCAFAQDTIVLKNTLSHFEDFFSKIVDDFDIENYINQELKKDYIVVSLDECIDVALQNNCNIKITQAMYMSSFYDYKNALTKFLPIFSVASYISDYRGQILVGGVLSDDLHETAVSVALQGIHELTQGGKQIFEAKAKKYFSSSKKHEHNSSVSRTVYEVYVAYYRLLMSKKNVEIYFENLVDRKIYFELSKKCEKIKNNDNFNSTRAKRDFEIAKSQLLTSLFEFKKRQYELVSIMSINQATYLMPIEEDKITIDLFNSDLTLDELIKSAYEKRQDINRLKSLVLYNNEIKNTYKTEFIPKPYLLFQERFQGTLDTTISPNYMLTFNLDWMPGENLSLGTTTKIKSQNEKIKATKLELENLYSTLIKNIYIAYSNYFYNKSQMNVSKTKIKFATETLKIA